MSDLHRPRREHGYRRPRRARRQLARLIARLAAMALVLGVVLVGATVVLQRSLHAEPADGSPAGRLAGPSQPIGGPLPGDLLDAPIDYVALGDSYVAGPGITPQRTDPVACSRSGDNYPAYLAQWLAVDSYRDVSCSGATTWNVTAPQERFDATVAPQLAALSADTDLVTVGLGANDIGIYPNLILRCLDVAGRHHADGACRDADRRTATPLLDAARGVATNVSGVLARIAVAAPNASVVVVGYPPIFPEGRTCAALGFSPADATWGAAVLTTINAGLRAAAAENGDRYVDLEAAGAGHDVCSDRPWMSGRLPAADTVPWHPYREGMRAMAGAVLRQLTGDRPPEGGADAEDAAPPAGAVVRNVA